MTRLLFYFNPQKGIRARHRFLENNLGGKHNPIIVFTRTIFILSISAKVFNPYRNWIKRGPDKVNGGIAGLVEGVRPTNSWIIAIYMPVNQI
jgi:hypothetical protein